MSISQRSVFLVAVTVVLAVFEVTVGRGQTIPDPKNLDFTGVQVQWDIAYLGPDHPEKLDLYRPQKLEPGKRYPGMVLIHGGGWTMGKKGDLREQNFGTHMARAGYISVSIDYILASKERHPWPEILYQCKSAAQFLRKNAKLYQIDPDHIGVMGASAGGHLSLMVGLTGAAGTFEPPGPYKGVSSRVQAVANFYGPSDLMTTPEDQYAVMLFGLEKADAKGTSVRQQASPLNLVTRHSPPILIVQGSEDQHVPASQAEILDQKLKQEGVPHEFIFIKGAAHSFDFQPPQQDLRGPVIAFFDKYLKKGGK